jgi:hypothetical protein
MVFGVPDFCWSFFSNPGKRGDRRCPEVETLVMHHQYKKTSKKNRQQVAGGFMLLLVAN